MESQETSHLRTWIEIDSHALHHNVESFLRLIPKTTRFMAVIKSNAYGHGLVQVAKLLAESRILNQESGIKIHDSKFMIHDSRIWFGVDSITEASRLRREEIGSPIFVLGYTLPSRIEEAADKNIVLTVSSSEALKEIAALKARPEFHLKVDTGMHRQGFLPSETLKLIKLIKLFKLAPQGIYTHFASAKDSDDRRYTIRQVTQFGGVISEFEKAGFRNLIRHAAASGGALLFPESHLDMVRVGMGMYGYAPSEEFKIQNSKFKNIELKPVLTWKTIVCEVKEILKGSYVGYDNTERVKRNTKIAVLPVGYWHGYDRGLSNIGEVLIQGKRARVLGRVSMDMLVVDVTDIRGIKDKDEAVLIGKSGRGSLWADELAGRIGTTQYEFLTRLNPLIRRVTI